jgi:prepilin peptidase CpaA
VKLLAAIGALLQWRAGIEAEFYAFLAAAIIAPARLAYEGKLLKVLGNSLALVVNPFRPKERRRQITPEMMTSVRFGPAIFVGVFGAALVFWRPM